jgi:predicted amino acid racemase
MNIEIVLKTKLLSINRKEISKVNKKSKRNKKILIVLTHQDSKRKGICPNKIKRIQQIANNKMAYKD